MGILNCTTKNSYGIIEFIIYLHFLVFDSMKLR